MCVTDDARLAERLRSLRARTDRLQLSDDESPGGARRRPDGQDRQPRRAKAAPRRLVRRDARAARGRRANSATPRSAVGGERVLALFRVGEGRGGCRATKPEAASTRAESRRARSSGRSTCCRRTRAESTGRPPRTSARGGSACPRERTSTGIRLRASCGRWAKRSTASGRALQVLAGSAAAGGSLRRAGGQAAAPHLVELRARLHVLGPERRLDTVKQAFQPADQLRLRQANLGLARRALERDRQRLELLLQIFGEPFLQRVERLAVDRTQTLASGFVRRRLAHLFEQLADHRGDAQKLRGLRDELAALGRAAVPGHQNLWLLTAHGRLLPGVLEVRLEAQRTTPIGGQPAIMRR